MVKPLQKFQFYVDLLETLNLKQAFKKKKENSQTFRNKLFDF